MRTTTALLSYIMATTLTAVAASRPAPIITITPTNIKSPWGCNYNLVTISYPGSSAPPGTSRPVATPVLRYPVIQTHGVRSPMGTARGFATAPPSAACLVIAPTPASTPGPQYLPRRAPIAPTPPLSAVEVVAREERLIQLHLRRAAAGIADSQLELAKRFWRGTGVATDQERAILIALAAAEADYAAAEHWLLNPH